MTHTNQSGRTMLEMLGVIGIMGIIAYGVLSGINSGMTSYKVNQMYIEIGDIINKIQEMYLTVYGRNNFPELTCDTSSFTYRSNCDGDTNCEACKALVDNDILRNNIHELNIVLSNNQLKVTFYATSKEICERLIAMDWAVQSIDCKDNLNRKCSDEGVNCCSNNGTNQLVFELK